MIHSWKDCLPPILDWSDLEDKLEHDLFGDEKLFRFRIRRLQRRS